MAKTAKKTASKAKGKTAAKKGAKTNNKKGAKPNKKTAKVKGSKEVSDALKALMKKPKDELTPLEKARLARASGKSKKTKKKARMLFKAPADMKPISLRATLMFGKDGHMTQSRLMAIKGKVGSDSAKSIDLSKYDPSTASSVVARIAGPIFIKSEKKRLPPGLMVQALIRVGKSAKHGGVITSVKEVRAKIGDKKPKALAKKDPMYRAIRKCARPLEAAFTKLKPFPSAKELKALSSEEESQD
jgi:hypothetical protein